MKNVADINAKDRYGKTALHIAVIHNCEEIVKILIDNGADVNAIDGYLFRKLTPIHYAAINNNTAITKLLIDAGADINFQTHEGSSPLIIACCKNNTETAVVLIENGANVNEYYKAHNEYNCHYSPIKYAIKNGNGLLTKVLIFNGAFVAQETGFSPLHVAAIYNRADIIDLLIANNAYVNVIYTTGGKHKKYYTPLDYATQHNNIESIDKLISYGGIRKR
ncbi:hypothetical protein FACS189449_07970 [Alphaproteobacteria bacterium]|nr:hypothetical protein FACS189449_07970 [Alphaproteobacteria bacterium]